MPNRVKRYGTSNWLKDLLLDPDCGCCVAKADARYWKARIHTCAMDSDLHWMLNISIPSMQQLQAFEEMQ